MLNTAVDTAAGTSRYFSKRLYRCACCNASVPGTLLRQVYMDEDCNDTCDVCHLCFEQYCYAPFETITPYPLRVRGRIYGALCAIGIIVLVVVANWSWGGAR
jgi:hypothetical protein